MLDKIGACCKKVPSYPDTGMDITHLTNLQVYAGRANRMDIDNLLNPVTTSVPTSVYTSTSTSVSTSVPGRDPILDVDWVPIVPPIHPNQDGFNNTYYTFDNQGKYVFNDPDGGKRLFHASNWNSTLYKGES